MNHYVDTPFAANLFFNWTRQYEGVEISVGVNRVTTLFDGSNLYSSCRSSGLLSFRPANNPISRLIYLAESVPKANDLFPESKAFQIGLSRIWVIIIMDNGKMAKLAGKCKSWSACLMGTEDVIEPIEVHFLFGTQALSGRCH